MYQQQTMIVQQLLKVLVKSVEMLSLQVQEKMWLVQMVHHFIHSRTQIVLEPLKQILLIQIIQVIL